MDFGTLLHTISSITPDRPWGIDIPNYKEYLEELESTPIAYFTATPPLLTERLNYLLVFFLNHGINDIEGYSLVDLPKERYGNSYNWGSYILSLNPIEQFKLLSHLSLYCHEQIDKSSKNREQLKRAKDTDEHKEKSI